jgi:hypothetical protein
MIVNSDFVKEQQHTKNKDQTNAVLNEKLCNLESLLIENSKHKRNLNATREDG